MTKIVCDVGPDCVYWENPYHCKRDGINIGGQIPVCRSFEQDLDYLRATLGEKLSSDVYQRRVRQPVIPKGEKIDETED